MPRKVAGVYKHQGKFAIPAYRSWRSMLDRCTNPKAAHWHQYGGRGVKVCAQWDPKQGGSWEQFFADMGHRPTLAHTLDKDRNGDGMLYAPETCAWATMKEQNRTRRVNSYWTYDGKTQCLTQWAEDYGLPRTTLRDRLIKHGWPIEKALGVQG